MYVQDVHTQVYNLLTDVMSWTLPWAVFPAAYCSWPADLSA